MEIIRIENNYQDIINYLWAKGYKWSDGQILFDYTPSYHVCFILVDSSNKTIAWDVNERHSISLEQFKLENPITLKDLKPGMVIEHSGGRRLVYEIQGEKFAMTDIIYCDLNDYSNDLINPNDFCNINKVYLVKESNSLRNMLRDVILIWKRPKDKVELTMNEIAEKFGIDVSQLRIKK